MKNSTKIIFASLLFMMLFFVFNTVEFEQLNPAVKGYLQSLIFSTTGVVSIFVPKFRNILFYVSAFLLSLVIGFYLMNQIALSNSMASIGVGILLIASLSYLPQLIKKGYVENL